MSFSISSYVIANDIDDIKIELKKLQQQFKKQQEHIRQQDLKILKLKKQSNAATSKNISNDKETVNDTVIDEIVEYIEEHQDNSHHRSLLSVA